MCATPAFMCATAASLAAHGQQASLCGGGCAVSLLSRDAAWGTLRRDCGHVRRLITRASHADGDRAEARLDRSTARLAHARLAHTCHV